MKQNSKPIKPKMGSSFWNNSAIKEEERINNLEKSQKDAIMLSDHKKSFLVGLIELEHDLIPIAEIFDSMKDTNSSIAPSLKKLIPANKRVILRDSKNKDLAEMVARLLPPLSILRNYMNEKFEEELKSKVQLRSSANGKEGRSDLLLFLDKADQIEKDLTRQIMSNRTKLTVNNLVKPILLSTLQRERKWSELNVPKQEYLQQCIACGHKSTNCPIENAEIKSYNEEKEKEYSNNLNQWTKYSKQVASGKRASLPASMKRKPYRRAAREPIVMCMCARSYCLGEFDGATSSCPIKCLKADNDCGDVLCDAVGSSKLVGIDLNSPTITKNRYEFIGDPVKICSCPICACNCNFACTIKDVPKLMLWKRTQEHVEKVKSVTQLEVADYETSSTPFLKSFMKDAMKVGFATMNQEAKFLASKSKSSSIDIKQEQYIENRGVTAACQQAAVNLVTNSPRMSVHDKKHLRMSVGKPHTEVLLPSGNYFDTKVIVNADGKHSKNNKLADDCKPMKIQPGMQSNLQIDWSDQSNVFQDFLDKKSKGDVICYNLTNDEENPQVEVMNKTPSESATVYHSNVNCDNEMIKKPKAINIDDEALNMHQRIVRKARCIVTREIKKRLDGGECHSAEQKKYVRNAKKLVLQLELSETQNTHLNAIKTVTDDGYMLLPSSTQSVDSDTVLDRIKLFHDIDED